jgi:hypothetical protein
LLRDPGVSFVELDAAGRCDLGGEQRSSLSKELVLDWCRAGFDPPTLPLDAVADDLCETADTPCGKFRLRPAMTPRPRLDRRRRVRTEGPLLLLQLLLAGRAAAVPRGS